MKLMNRRFGRVAVVLLLCLAMTLGFEGCEDAEAAISEINAELTSVRAQVKALEDKLAAEQAKNASLNSDLADALAKNEAQESEIAGLKDQIGQLKSQISVDEAPLEGYTKTDAVTEYVCINVTYTSLEGKRTNGNIVVQLDATQAPITVANFQKLVGEKFYDGLTFHRVIKNFMIQGGCPNGDGSGSSEPIKGEFSANGVANNISHVRGVISMARRGDAMDSGSCQFFIMHADATRLDGNYAAFGRVIDGMDIVDGIANTPATYNLVNYELSNPIHQVNIVKAYFVTPSAD